MKKILILITEKEKFLGSFLSAAKKLKINFDIHFYSEVSIEYKENKLVIRVDEKDLKNYDLIFFRTIGSFVEIATLISEYCLEHKIKIIDPVFQYHGPYIDRKSFEYIRLIDNKLPIIDSWFVSLEELNTLEEKIIYPCVVKKTDLNRGEGVFLCKNKKELRKIFIKIKGLLLIQKYIKADKDFRLLVIGNEVIGSIERSLIFRTDHSVYETNAYHPSKQEKKIAVRAAQALGYSIAGVDLIFDSKNKKWKILEVNRAPVFKRVAEKNNINVSEKIIKFLKDQI